VHMTTDLRHFQAWCSDTTQRAACRAFDHCHVSGCTGVVAQSFYDP
jgi:hypothetical protein